MFKKTIIFCVFLLCISCQNFGQLNLVTDLPNELKEVSGVEFVKGSNLIWMINDILF